MKKEQILDHISRGRTDLVFELLELPDWESVLHEGHVKVLRWFVYYNDLTALKAILHAGGDLESIDLDQELGNASFFGHWKLVDFLIKNGADVNFSQSETGETSPHGALSKAGRPYYLYVVKLLVESGADVNAKTFPGKTTGAFMRDVRTKGETPLHLAAAYSDAETIKYLIDKGANPKARDVNGDSPITWASEHLRPGEILRMLSFGDHVVSEKGASNITSDHGAGWGNGMERNILGDFLAENLSEKEGKWKS